MFFLQILKYWMLYWCLTNTGGQLAFLFYVELHVKADFHRQQLDGLAFIYRSTNIAAVILVTFHHFLEGLGLCNQISCTFSQHTSVKYNKYYDEKDEYFFLLCWL
jgi:hypothetical protein